MLFAIETATGRQIHADDGSRYRTYHCPVCKGEVFLRSGQYNASHFAHRHETAKPECELYTPSENQFDSHRKPTHPFTDRDRVAEDNLSISPPDICLEVEDRKSNERGRLPRWNLCIKIPKSPDGRGQITFDCGPGSFKNISLRKLFRNPITYPVDPDTNDFKAVWISADTNPVYREVISERISGLNKNGVTAFIGERGRYKPRARRIVWGHAYYFVWPKSFDLNIPSNLEVLAFENNKDWSCVLSALPESRDETTANWLERVCSINVKNSSTSWSLLYPFLSTYAFDGFIQVPAFGGFIVGCNRIEEVNETKACANFNGERFETLLPCKTKSVVALAYFDTIPNFFELTGNNHISFSFRAPAVQSLAIQPVALVEVESATKGSIRVPLHTVEARKWLEEVRAGRARLNGITLPEAVQGKLAWRSNLIAAWDYTPLNRREDEGQRWLHQVKLARSEVEQIQSVLRLTGDEVLLSFRSFGEHHFLSVDEEGSHAIRLSRRLRNRILWLQREISLVYGDGQPVAGSVSDHDLIQCFLALKPPPSLVGHYQSIRRSVSNPPTRRTIQGID
ncbi:MAG: competence protein CoiA family protein [Gammaproteobacteria bacterium]|nr:competence protein CoiA family protein [Gammaproteobacteria bacterium]